MKKSVLASIVGVSSIGMLKGLSGSKSILSFFGVDRNLIRIDFSFRFKPLAGVDFIEKIRETLVKMKDLSESNIDAYWDEDEEIWDYDLFYDADLPDLQEYEVMDPEDVYSLNGMVPVRVEVVSERRSNDGDIVVELSFYFEVSVNTIDMNPKNFMYYCEMMIMAANACVFDDYGDSPEVYIDTFEFIASDTQLPIVNTNTSIRRY